MLVDRVFGLMAGVAFVLGLICQVEWLTNSVEPPHLSWSSTIFFALAIIVLAYMVIYVGRRDGLSYNEQGELNLMPVLRALPGWARVVGYGQLMIAAVLLVLTVVSLFPTDLLPNGVCVFQSGSPETTGSATVNASCLFPNLLMSALTATFGALAFIEAVYLLRTSSPNM